MIVAPDQARANFDRWFGASKVVDADGRPLVVYHGTTADFESFDPVASFDGGFHFGTDDAANARLSYWLDGADDTAHAKVIPAYLSIRNPKQLTADPYDEETWSLQIEQAKDEGHDGILYPNKIEGGTSWVVFEPTQIKSIFNNGLWNPESASLTDHPADKPPGPRNTPKG